MTPAGILAIAYAACVIWFVRRVSAAVTRAALERQGARILNSEKRRTS